MKIIVTTIPIDLVTNSLLSSFCPFLQTKNKNQVSSRQVGGLVTRNISVFCLQRFLFFVYSESRSASKPYRIQQTFIKEFSYLLFLFVLWFHDDRYMLAVMNTLSLALQKQGSLLVDIKYMVDITTNTLQKLSVTNTLSEFTDILSPRKSSYANNQHFITLLTNQHQQFLFTYCHSHYKKVNIGDRRSIQYH